jgi:hypothetical protein
MRLMVDSQVESVSLNGHALAIQYVAGSSTSGTPEPGTVTSLTGGLGLFGLLAYRTNRFRNSRSKG